ncbi:hypothetical protein ABBQ32_013944 [Trebouxia sp. C0010 RCD-2024]
MATLQSCMLTVPISAGATHRPARPSLSTCPKRQTARPFGSVQSARRVGTAVCKAAADQDVGLEGIIGKLSEKYENANNKPAVAAWAGASVFAIFFAEWLIHRPGLNILLGFPIQLFGLLLLPGAIVKYLVEKDDPSEDVRGALNKLAKRLPGLEKESF